MAIVAAGLLAYSYIYPIIDGTIRRDRFVSIVKNLNFNEEDYVLQSEHMLGGITNPDWTTKNSYYAMQFVRNVNVDQTISEIKQIARDAGLEYLGEPYPGGSTHSYDYKTPKGEYVRIFVSSRPRDDEFYNRHNMSLSIIDIDIDPNLGPTNVIVNVNLDTKF